MKLLIERRQPASGSSDWVWPTNTHRVLRQIFSRRSIDSPEELERNLARLRPVNQFTSLERAVDLLCKHRSQRVVIVGDFDADGATSTALMYLCLKKLSFSKFNASRFSIASLFLLYSATFSFNCSISFLNPTIFVYFFASPTRKKRFQSLIYFVFQ